ncbi:acid-sensing ion channel 4-A-like [Patiria miniata]|uniref:Uncharacterized protein n=1 Tax=Patiria miniata TaxID=46514 RepID=A0A913ZG74_PATMI|nr:acid-sensing ion channel 4-A-like [Patiria miniata]
MACDEACKKPEHTSNGAENEKPSLEYQFATTTTLHGIGRVAESSGARAKIPWILALLVASGVYVYVTADRIQAYLKYEANTNVIIEFNKTLAFPAVTICNYNRFMKYRIDDDDKKYVSRLLRVEEYLSDYDYQDFNFSQIDDDFNYTNFALSSGFLLEDSLHECSWKGGDKSCDASNFSSYYSPTFGQCYTFNGPGENRKIYAQSRQGIGNGLRLIIDIRQPDYTETYESGHVEAGLKFAIHPPDELPLIDTMGLSAAPGLHTYASMRLVRHINLPKPWGVCGTEEAEEEPMKYSRNTCLRNCRRDAIILKCSCQPLGHEKAYRPDSDRPSPVRHCDIDDFRCVRDALRIHRASSLGPDCVCPVACDYVTYETTLSSAIYPSQSVIKAAISDIGDVSSNDDIEYVKANMVYLDVYYTDLSTITYEQVQALPFTALLGDLGGQLGLFLGASVLTAMEIMDYITRRLQLLIKRVKSRKKVQNGT